MTASELKRLYERNNPDGNYFDRATMRFFGDTMRNFYVVDGGLVKTYSAKRRVAVWVLCRRRPVNGGLVGVCAYFSKKDGRIVSVEEEA
jgi:hypothetical protein